MGLKNIRSDATKKADRKFEKKLEFYSKVRETVASLSATKAIAKKSKSARKRQKKLKAYDLSLLNEVLPEVKESQQPAPPPKKLNCKSRQKLVIKETKRMEAILNHPAFQSDPFAAIHRYLVNTQPAPKAEPVKKKSKDDAKKKRKKTKSSSKPQSMEM
ncbi:putative ribosome biogenesis protein slx9-like [Chenopodium quinoa]|uniref:putative ribosome biogenesis protein slx9-like n=1 Tax=Chenopodium quinoa TaxID=63459 RepID=UPI000B77AA63|nr:putative ribosome biogenesis protein slx9-like [Chenopodium quinoa]